MNIYIIIMQYKALGSVELKCLLMCYRGCSAVKNMIHNLHRKQDYLL